MAGRTWVIMAGAAALLYAAAGDYASARRKFDLIESDRLPAGARVDISAGELNAYVRRTVAEEVPQGVRNPNVELGADTATGTALVDFGKLRRAQGEPPGWLLSQVLDGERPVKVVARIHSGGGRATVDVESVEVSGIQISGTVLDFLIRNYLIPMYPEAKIGEPFALGHRIDRLDVRPAQVAVLIRK